jgi:hypothetical protein
MRIGVARDLTSDLLFSNDLDQHSFSPSAVEFAVENLFPRSEIQFAFGDRDDNFTAHDLTLEMGVGVIFSSPVVSIGAGRRVALAFQATTRSRDEAQVRRH